MKQKPQTLTINDKSLKHLFFRMVFKVNANRSFKKQTNIGAYLIGIIINMLIFLGSREIGIMSNTIAQFGSTVEIALFGIVGFTLLQFAICFFYKFEFYIGMQFKLTRFIVWPIGMNLLLAELLKENQSYFLYLALGFFVVVYVLNVLFESQSFTDNYLYNKNLPITSFLLIVEGIFYGINIVQEKNMVMLFSCIMVIVSFIIKSSFFVNQTVDHAERKILSVSCFMYCVYSLIIFVSALSGNQNLKIILCFVAPIVVYYSAAQMVKSRMVPVTFKRIFSSDSLTFQEFIVYIQYIIDQANQFNQAVHSNFCESLTFTFFSEHEKYCERPGCKFHSQNWKDEFRNASDPKIVKKLTQKVIRKLQTLFDEVNKNEPENIELKLGFIKFYIHTLPNKIRVLELISEIENMNRTLITDYEIFKMRILSDQMDSIEVIDNLKTDDEVNQFQRVAYLTINSMMEFWMHFSEEKIDLVKVMNTSQRLLTYKKEMQAEWEKNKNEQKYSTLKIALLYSYYLKNVAHDEKQSQLLEYSAKALEEKLLHKKEIKYLSFGSESALIGASLTDESLGKIVIANNQASNIFNYSKQEISKIALNSIMPKLYAEQHDHYLLEFQKNKYKRINSDERLLFGKDKHGFVIPILLQLQRTISSISQELLFIANIRKFKVRQTPLICITDEEGELTDISSGFKEVFYERKESGREKIEIPIRNIQEIIPSFFQKTQSQDCGHFKFVEKFYKERHGGDITIEFTVTPISFPLKPNGGFVVMGNRQTANQGLHINYLTLTKEIDSRVNKNELEGSRTFYNPVKNRYEVDNKKVKFSRRQQSKDQIYTIPFINIHDMASIFNMGKDEINYGQKIRIVRLTEGGALIRVENNDTFESEEMSENQKVNRFQFKLKQLKYQYLHNKNNLLFISFGRIFILIILLVLGLVFFFQMNHLQSETSSRIGLLKESKFRFQVRGYISQYILSFNGLSTNFNNVYFSNKTHAVRDRLVNVIEEASIAQTQKQPMFKTVFLQDETDLKKLITSETLAFPSLEMANVIDIVNLWIVYMVVLSLFLILQIIMKCMHSNKIYGVYHVFLGVDERLIKRSYDSCLKFSQMLQERQGQEKRENHKNANDENDEDNENPVSRMKKYKENSQLNLITYAKNYLSFLLIILVCIILCILIEIDADSFNKEIQIFNRVEGLFPESSIALMNSYFKSYKKSSISISETFNSTYQQMDSAILSYETQNRLDESFFETLMSNACGTTLGALSAEYAKFCSTVQESIFQTGIDKVTNHLALQIQNINSNAQNVSTIDDKFFDLFQLVYDYYVPMVKNVSSLIHEEMMGSVEEFENKYKIWMGLITLVVAINSFYIYHILMNEMKEEIELVKELLYFIPDNEIEDKAKANKKTIFRASKRMSKDIDE